MTPDSPTLPPAPTDAGGFCRRGAALVNEGRYDEAIAVLSDAVRLDPTLADAHVHLGIARFHKGDPAGAVADFSEAIRLNPGSAWAFAWRGTAHDEQGQAGPAVADFSEAIRLDPNHADHYINRAVASYNAADYAAAVADCGESIRLGHDHARAFRIRGLALYQIGRHEEALADLNEAIRLDPSRPDALQCRGAIRHHRGDLDAAVADYDAAIRLAPANADARVSRGAAFHRDRDYDAALADYTEALRLNPRHGTAYRYRGQAYYELNDYDEALADLNEAARLNPRWADVYLLRGKVRQAEEELDAAVSDYTKAIRLAPQDARGYCERAGVWWEREEFPKALDDFSEAARLDPGSAAAYRGRALVWEHLGETGKAEADFEAASRITSEGDDMQDRRTLVYTLLQDHFAPTALDGLAVTERRFPTRVRADLQRAVDGLLGEWTVRHFSGVRKQYAHQEVNFTDLLVRDRNDPALSVPPQYEEIDVGDAEPVRCLKGGLWLLEEEGVRFAVFLEPEPAHGRQRGMRFQVGTANDEAGTRITQRLFQRLEKAVRESRAYRGKALSLEWEEAYSGAATGVKVHRLRAVGRDQVILPRKTLELLERNVIQFVRQRARLAAAGLATKKGLLFYGPPGAGKTHTIHYLAGALEGMTTLLITAEQVGLLGEYMTLARLLQPSMVVIEDADLIARERTEMNSACEEVLLNRLLNEMDGLKEDADILFVLTTNRPEALEAALASRPGRVDQAIEFPFPDEEGREKLVRLYARGMRVSAKVVRATVKKTEGVSAAFIKELMRRAAQFRLEAGKGHKDVRLEDVDNALEEMLFRGGALNRKLLGGRVEETERDGE